MSADLSLLEDAAREAGQIALKYWRSDPQVWEKPDGGGPVSEADLAVDRFLHERLLGAKEGYGWLSEESEDDTSRTELDRVFIVDPIDGTRAFLAGEKAWSIAVAISDGGSVTHAVVYLPGSDHLYSATRSTGARRDGVPIHVTTHGDPETADMLATRPNFDPAFWRGAVPKMKRHFRPSLAYRLCLVAEGRFDGMLTFRPAWEWDIAAGCLIAAEAGASVSDRRGRTPVFNGHVPKIDSLLVAAPDLHQALMARVSDRPWFA